MDLRELLEALMARPIAPWPAFICEALDERSGRVCGLDAQWLQFPVPQAKTAWTYCGRHAPTGAVPIPDDVPYAVTRLALRVAIAGRPGDLEASADEAVRRAVFALEDVGATVIGLRVVGGKASQEAAEGPTGRLQLAGRPQPSSGRAGAFIAFEEAPARLWWRRGKTR
jgi:hypothetical protein